MLLLLTNPEMIPASLEFIKIAEPSNTPIIFQLLILEFAIDGLRLASLSTPSMFSTPLVERRGGYRVGGLHRQLGLV